MACRMQMAAGVEQGKDKTGPSHPTFGLFLSMLLRRLSTAIGIPPTVAASEIARAFAAAAPPLANWRHDARSMPFGQRGRSRPRPNTKSEATSAAFVERS